MGRTLKRHRRLFGIACLWLGWASVVTPVFYPALAAMPASGAAGPATTPTSATVNGLAASLPHRHMIVTSNRRATEAGLAILREGGSAIDAAVAAAAVLSVTRPDRSGFGGGGVMLYYDAAAHRVSVWDGRETAPAAARPDMFLESTGKLLDAATVGPGGRAVGTPGLLRMLDIAQRRHGKLPWERLFDAATTLAETGTPVSPALAAAIAGETARLSRQVAARSIVFGTDGKPLPAGAPLLNKPLAEMFRAVAAGRSDALLSGPVAADIATTIRTDANPGLMTVDDLAATTAVERRPICLSYRTHMVCSAGPPSTGGVTLLESLGILEHADGAAATGMPTSANKGFPGPRQETPSLNLAAVHLLAEAERLAQADAALYIADPAFVRAPVDGLLAEDYLGGRAGLIDKTRALPSVSAGAPSWDKPELRAAPPDQLQTGTADLIVIDDAGDAVALSASVQDRFGSGLMVHGVLLNDALTAFSPLPERQGIKVANQVEPGKRPATPMAPAMVLSADGHIEMLLGAIGGGRIAAQLTQALVEAIDLQRSPAATLAQPQVGARTNTVELESNTTAVALAPGLRAMGHDIDIRPAPRGLTFIEITSAGLTGAADPRDSEADCAGD
jgi:gamma-glutamyltranspeptidase/glutathione hydrolase